MTPVHCREVVRPVFYPMKSQIDFQSN